MVGSFWLRIKIIIGLVCVLVGVHIANVMLEGQLQYFGILPRHWGTWYHIFTSPFIHQSYGHLINNIIGLSIFSAICLLRPVRYFVIASFFIIVVAGVLVWLFGRPAIHIGASGWIFGLWSLSIMTAWFDRSFKNLCIAVFVVFLYGGMIYGILPTRPGVSYEAHLFGCVAGILFAAMAAKSPRFKRALR
ncbi:rhomboid family intramembrane serine protease [Teredinibacter sp. KSP-S5-2]|uniref:rhomboid family intramembrane serine protease n=1 Tax=Teredinibacter sp. KSP-S5-2 TaxID=3034506 RepID=UPI0029352280|nr:rhomboid family intramembrane serine protease [Teredinibacter sp. KSP-S5-2]WNO09139.1 rhomboid family intramembrane serine protease [Teredinibacter sp. KSP-S5-2]